MNKLIKRKGFRFSIIAILILILSATLFNIFYNGKDLRNTKDFINEFEKRGYKVGRDHVAFGFDPFRKYNGKSKVMSRDDISIEYYEFGTEDEAKAASQTISKDGKGVGDSKVNWGGNSPRFYRNGNIIVIYGGTDFKILWDLRIVMGKSVGGTPIHKILWDKLNKLMQAKDLNQ